STFDVIIDRCFIGGMQCSNSASYICGIRAGATEFTPGNSDIKAGKNTITNNTVGNLFTFSNSQTYAFPGAAVGIMCYSFSNNNLIDNNTVVNISAYNTAAAN